MKPTAPLGNKVGVLALYSRSHDAVLYVYDAAGNVIKTHEHVDDFNEPMNCYSRNKIDRGAPKY